jgi:hypothetical protein
LLHFPSLLLVPYMLLVEGAMLSAVSLLRLHLSPADVLLAVLALLTAFGALAAAFAVTRRWFSCVIGPRRRERLMPWETRSGVWSKALWLLEGSREWCNTPPGQQIHFKKRFIFFFETNSVPWYVLAELGLYLFQSMVIGIRSNSNTACRVQASVLLVAHVVACAAAIVLLPCFAPIDNIFLVTQRVLGVVVAAITLYSIVTLNASGFEAVEVASAVGNLLSSGQSVLLVLMKLLALIRRLHQWAALRKQRRLEAEEEEKEEDEDEAERRDARQGTSLTERLPAAGTGPVLVLHEEGREQQPSSTSSSCVVRPGPPPRQDLATGVAVADGDDEDSRLDELL